MSGEDRAVGAPERLHPLFLLTGFGGALRGMLGGYAAIGYFAATGQLRVALFAAAALLLFALISIAVFWLRFEFRVGEAEIRIDSGLVSRTSRSIPFDRIQDVDIAQGPVARLLGLAKVTFETGGAGGSNRDEGVLQAIALHRALELRALIRGRRETPPLSEPGATEEPATPVYAMDMRRLAVAGVFNFSLALFAGLAGLTQTVGEFAGFDPLSRSFWQRLLVAGDPIADFVLANRLTSAVAGVALLGLLGVLTGIVRTALRNYGFRLERSATGLRRRRGLLTVTDVTLPVQRVQAAVVATGPVRDRFRWRELRLQNLARDDGSGDHVVAPLARDEEIARILTELGWRPVDPDIRWKTVSRAYVWTLAFGLSPLFLLALVQTLIAPAIGAAMLVALAGGVALRWLAWRRTGYTLDADRLLVRSGWWRRRLRVLPLGKIQSIDVAESFISRWFGVGTLSFGVAGGGGFSAHTIPAVPREEARALRTQLLV